MTPTRTRVTQLISADPTSTALLLASPTAFELWPGVRRVADIGAAMVVETELGPDRAVAANVRALPPRRTPTAYVSRFTWVGPGLPETSGELTLAYAPAAQGLSVTHASLVLDSADLTGSALDEPLLRRLAEGFLANLARAAEQRNHAA